MLKYMKLLVVALVVVMAGLSLSGTADAHGRVFVGVGFGGYYGPAYPYYPPAYYYPPPAYYYPPAAYVTPAPAAPYASSYCRQFNGDATIDASGAPFRGTACLGADNRWHITQ
jgi:hypothetical protein